MDWRSLPVSLGALAILMGIAIPWAIHVEKDLSELKALLAAKASSEDKKDSAVVPKPSDITLTATSSDAQHQTIQITGPLVASAASTPAAEENGTTKNQRRSAARKASPQCAEKRQRCALKREFCLHAIVQAGDDGLFMVQHDSKVARTQLQAEREMRDDCNTEFERCDNAAQVFCD